MRCDCFPRSEAGIIGIGLALLVALALIANGFMIWRTDARLQARIDAIRAAGDPATIADLTPSRSLSTRMRPLYRQARAAAGRVRQGSGPLLRQNADRQAYDAAVVATKPRPRNNSPPFARSSTSIRISRRGSRPQRLASSMPRSPTSRSSHHQLIEDSIDRVQKIRTALGSLPGGWKCSLAKGRRTRPSGRESKSCNWRDSTIPSRLLISHLVGVAVRMTVAQPLYDALATGQVSPDTLTLLDKELELQDDPEQLVHVLKTEQAFGISVASEGAICPQMEGVNPVWFKLVGWPVKSMFVDSLDVYDDYLELARKPWYEIHHRFDANGSMRAVRARRAGRFAGSSLGSGLHGKCPQPGRDAFAANRQRAGSLSPGEWPRCHRPQRSVAIAGGHHRPFQRRSAQA